MKKASSEKVNKMIEALKNNPVLLREFDKNMLKILTAANVSMTSFNKVELFNELAIFLSKEKSKS